MLSKLSLIDFKTYKNTVFEFSPGINVITGDSGHGKTNVLLGLNWAINDRPRGTGCIRRGRDTAVVGCEVIDGKLKSSVTRTKGKSGNSYVIEQDGVKQPPLTTFGKDTLDLVSSVLDLSDINVQKQREQHFLVYSPPGQVASYIRSITKLDEIDEVKRLLCSDVRSEKSEIAHQQTKLETAIEKLEILNAIDLEQFAIKIAKAKDILFKVEQIKEKREKIRSIVEVLRELEANRISIPKDVNLLFNKFEKYSKAIAELFELKDKLKTLSSKIKEHEANRISIPNNVDSLFEKFEEYSNLVTELSERKFKLGILVQDIKEMEDDITLPEDLTILSTAEDILEKYDTSYKKIEIMFDLFDSIENIESTISDSLVSLNMLEKEKAQLEEQLEICPSCGEILSEDSKKTLLGR